MTLSLQQLVSDMVTTSIIDNKMSLLDLNAVDTMTKESIMYQLQEPDFKAWKAKMIYSLVDIESKNWDDIDINFVKYYDDCGDRDYYPDLDIYYKGRDDEDDDTYFDEDDDLDEPYLYGVKKIKQYIHPYYKVYMAKARSLFSQKFIGLSSIKFINFQG